MHLLSTRIIGLKFGSIKVFVLNNHAIVWLYSFRWDVEVIDENVRHSSWRQTEAVNRTELHKLSFKALRNKNHMLENMAKL